MEAAIGGLIGVVIGALATGGSQLFLEWRRERRDRHRARLVIAAELHHGAVILNAVSNAGDWFTYPNVDSALPATAWQEHRSQLVASVDGDLRKRLVMAYAQLEITRGSFMKASELTETGPIAEWAAKEVKRLGAELKQLSEELADVR